MMYQKKKFPFGYIKDLKCRVLELPYEGKDLSMVILLPDDIQDEATGLKKVRPRSPRGARTVCVCVCGRGRSVKRAVFLPCVCPVVCFALPLLTKLPVEWGLILAVCSYTMH